jgi:hypothetical protein|tara:strand:- start:1994 stop:2212 length:219 start_codon:yes stop_codon:yes gene_type:complete
MTDIEDRLTDIVSEALKRELTSSNSINSPFLDVEDYKKKTGKRFRRTRNQIESGLTKEQSFQQYMETMVEKN